MAIESSKFHFPPHLTYFFLFWFLVFTWLMAPSAAIIGASVYNIIDFEFAATSEQARTVLHAWDAETIQCVKNNLWLDMGWLIGYGGLVAGLNFGHARHLPEKYQKKAVLMSRLAILAAFLDLIENINLLLIVYYPKTFPIFAPGVAAVCAAVKFTCIGLAIGSYFVFGIIRLVARVRS